MSTLVYVCDHHNVKYMFILKQPFINTTTDNFLMQYNVWNIKEYKILLPLFSKWKYQQISAGQLSLWLSDGGPIQ